ncbi:MAG: hypothetical protein IJZ08_03790 [Clostridia bacterium]|nr:hypothetical protein [Clostridia bacterium]
MAAAYLTPFAAGYPREVAKATSAQMARLSVAFALNYICKGNPRGKSYKNYKRLNRLTLFLDTTGARKSFAKRTPLRKGCAPLQPRHLLKKVDENF